MSTPGLWSHWERWCAGRGVAVAPGDPRGLRLPHRTRRRRPRVGSLDLACTAIRHVHRHARTCTTRSTPGASVRYAAACAAPSAPHPGARPDRSRDEIRQIVDHIDRSTPLGLRDAAMILLGYASAMRRSELVALTLADLEDKPAGLMLTVRRSKTDPDADGEVVAVAHGQHAATDPVAALDAWRDIRGADARPGVHPHLGEHASPCNRSPATPCQVLRTRATPPGLDGARITAHSLRAGHATTAALAGVPLDRIAAQTRHKDLSVLVDRYIRPLEALATTSSKDLGL